MSRSLLQRLAAEVKEVLARLRDNLRDPDARRAAYGEVGIDPDVPPPPEDTWENLNQLNRYAGEAEADLQDWREAVDNTILVMHVVRESFDAAAGGDTAKAHAWLRGLVAAHSLPYIKEQWPALYAFARLVGAVEETVSIHFTEQVRYDRLEAMLTREFWDRFLDISERDEDDDDQDGDQDDDGGRRLQTEADAQRLSELTLLPLGPLLMIGFAALGAGEDVTVLYGWDPLPESPTPEADRIAGRTLSLSTTLQLGTETGDGDDSDDTDPSDNTLRLPVSLTVLWMPRDHGGPALLASVDAGSLTGTVERPDGRVLRVSFDLGGSDRATVLVPVHTDAASKLLARAGVSEGAYEVTVEEVHPPGEPWVLGDPNGLRVEVGRRALSVGYRVTGRGSSADASLIVRVVARDSRLVLATGEADPVVRRSLEEAPRDALQAPFDLGLVLEIGPGGTSVRLEGGTGLNAVVPLGREAGPVRVHHLTLSFGGAEADGRPLLVLEATLALTLDLGWVSLALEGLGLAWDLRSPRDLGFRAPTGIGLELSLGPVSGGGFLLADRERGLYAAVFSLGVEPFWVLEEGLAVTAVAIVGDRDGRRDIIAFLGIESDRPVPLPLQFTLNGLGGIVADNRTVAAEALRSGLRGRDLDAILFPDDAAANAPALVAALDRLFPPSPGQRVVGMMVRFGWGVPTNLLVADVAVLYEEPAPKRFLLLGRIAAAWKRGDTVLVDLRLDVVGSWHTDRHDVELDGTLHRSRLVGFAVDGDGAWRSRRGGGRDFFLFSVGGYHPEFDPRTRVPKLRRLSLDLLSGENPRVRLEAYVAVTSNTVQVGARVELFYAKAGFSIEGHVAIDVLVDRKESSFCANIDVLVAVKRGRTVIASVHLTGTVSGLSPWCVTGSARLELLFFSVSFPVDVTAGEEAPPAALAPARADERLAEALADPRSWSAELSPDARTVTSLREPTGRDAVYVHPLGALEVSQGVVPLGVTIDHLDSAPLEGPRRFAIEEVVVGDAEVEVTQVRDQFAPGQFFALSDDERLARPSFERLPSGVAVTVTGGATRGTPVPAELGYETVVVDTAGHRSVEEARALSAAAMAEAVRAAESAEGIRQGRGRRGRFDLPGGPGRSAGVADPRFRVVSSEDLGPSGVPALDRAATFTEAQDGLARHLRDHPADRRRLRLVGAHEGVRP